MAERGFVSIAPAIDAVNSKMAAAAENAQRLQGQLRAQSFQRNINSSFGIDLPDNSASRAADIAALGSSLDDLRAKYSPLFSIQRDYLSTLQELNSLEARTALTENERTVAIARTKQAFAEQVVAAKSSATATGLAGYQMQNLGFQINDVVTGLASGQSPFTIAAQQGGQLFQILQAGEGGIRGSFGSIGAKITSWITPMRLAGASAAAVAAGGVLVYESWKKTALAMDETARQAGITMAQLKGLDQAAAIKGIGSNDLFDAMKAFSGDVYAARNNMGGLGDVLVANDMKASSFEQTLGSVAEIVKNLPNDQARLNVLQQAGLPATYQFLQLMKQGRAGIQGAIDDAARFGSVAEEAMVAKARAFDEAWNKGWKDFKTEFTSDFLALYGFFDGLNDRAMSWARRAAMAAGVDVKGNLLRSGPAAGNVLTNSQAGSFYDAVGIKTPSAGNGVDPAVLKQQISLEQQRIGILGGMASISDIVRQKENEITAARLNHVTVTASEAKALKALARENALGITAMKAQADATRIQAESLGMSAGAAAEYTATQTRLAEALRNKQVLTSQDVAAIKAQAAALGQAAQAAELARIHSDIKFGSATALLSSEDVQIAQQLKAIYPDVSEALKSNDASPMKMNAVLGPKAAKPAKEQTSERMQRAVSEAA
nr:phage tail length tape measure family protein [Bradyrhizobium sp. 23]